MTQSVNYTSTFSHFHVATQEKITNKQTKTREKEPIGHQV